MIGHRERACATVDNTAPPAERPGARAGPRGWCHESADRRRARTTARKRGGPPARDRRDRRCSRRVFVTYYAFAQQVPFISNPFTLHALVNNSVAVRADSPVRIAGIDVGKVQTVTAGRASPRRSTSRWTTTACRSTRDATIADQDRLFLEGGYYLELDPGSPSAPIAHERRHDPEGADPEPGAVLPVALDLQRAGAGRDSRTC